MTERRRWGKAGVRLDATQAAQNDRVVRQRRQKSKISHEADRVPARAKWAAGLMVPHRITTVLDAQGLYGPEVDEACGAAEPDVDRWEAGDLYPTWNQVLKLADLVGCTPMLLMTTDALSTMETSMRFHSKDALNQSPPIERFTPEAIAAMKETL